MISAANFALSTPPSAASSVSEHNPSSEPNTPRKITPSKQLSRWSRARSLRSGRKLTQPANGLETTNTDSDSPLRHAAGDDSFSDSESSVLSDKDSVSTNGEDGKSIFMVSDGTGWTAEHAVHAALGQFDYCLVDRACAVNTHLFSKIDDVDRLLEIIRQAAKDGAMVVYTLADPAMAESARQACQHWGVPCTDILSPITEAISSHLGASPSGLPRWAPGRPNPLTEEYFRRIEAVEFTIKQDDGALPENLRKADIILTGVSRTSKTPLSIYLAQKGYRVANVPIVMGVALPKTLFEVNPKKVFGLTINPLFLHEVRKARAKSLSFSQELRTNYSELDHVKRELEYAGKIFAQNPSWPVIEVTGKAIEETAAVVLGLYHDRKKKCSMPSISKRY